MHRRIGALAAASNFLGGFFHVLRVGKRAVSQTAGKLNALQHGVEPALDRFIAQGRSEHLIEIRCSVVASAK